MGLVIGVDADDVIIDLLSRWLEVYNSRYGDTLRPDNITEWDMLPFVKPECGEKIYDILLEEDLYDGCKLIPGAVRSINILRASGHQVVVITAAHNPSKLQLLKNHGIVQHQEQYIVESNKWNIPVDVLIDDNYTTIERFNNARPGSCGILFDRAHNRAFMKDYHWRAVGWSGWGGVMSIINQYEPSNPVTIKGLGKDAPTVVNESGGRQSAINYRFDLIDPLTLFNMAEILHNGAEKYGAWNWRNISLDENLNHALSHIFAFMAGDKQDNHLGNAFCRLMFALSVYLTPGESQRMLPENAIHTETDEE
jgi:5'(3')-deoxyribonucleotidase